MFLLILASADTTDMWDLRNTCLSPQPRKSKDFSVAVSDLICCAEWLRGWTMILNPLQRFFWYISEIRAELSSSYMSGNLFVLCFRNGSQMHVHFWSHKHLTTTPEDNFLKVLILVLSPQKKTFRPFLCSAGDFLTHTAGGLMLGFWIRMRCSLEVVTECNK